MSVENRLSFDPKLRDEGVPPEIPGTPIGAVDELKDLGLNLLHYRSCAQPNKAAGIRGCEKFEMCPLSIRGKASSEGGGPRALAWERIFRGKPVRRMEGMCWHLADDKDFVEENKGAVRIIAAEPGLGFPETYEKLEGVAVKDVTQTDGSVKRVLANEAEQRMPNVLREDMVVEKKVRPFVRPAENHEIAVDIITANVLREESARLQSESVATALGLKGAGPALDQRNEGTGKRKKPGESSSA